MVFLVPALSVNRNSLSFDDTTDELVGEIVAAAAAGAEVYVDKREAKDVESWGCDGSEPR